MRVIRSALTAFLVISAVNGGAMAATWHVEKDGSGDFAVIQDAVNASADGDTIRIGPGRYEEYQRYDIGAWRDEAIFVLLDRRSLTMIGSGEGSTVIGPNVPFDPTEHEHGIVLAYESSLQIEELTIDGIYSGIEVWQLSTASVQRCTFQAQGLGNGSAVFSPIGTVFRSCSFIGYHTGVLAHNESADVLIENCIFRSASYAVNTWGTSGLIVKDCRVEDSYIGVQLYLWSDGSITNLVADCYYNCINVKSHSSASIVGCDLASAGTSSIRVIDSSTVQGADNHIENQEGRCFWLYRSGVSMQDSWFSTGSGLVVDCIPGVPEESWTIDLRNNWWGVSDADSIEALIYDGNDDPNIGVIVDYLPFRDQQVANETLGWGDLKRLYR